MAHQWVNHLPPEDDPDYLAGRQIGAQAPPLAEDQRHRLDVLLNGPAIPDIKTA